MNRLKLFLTATAILTVLLLATVARADDLKVIGKDEMDTRPSIGLAALNDVPFINKIPSLKNGFFYSMVDHKLNYSGTVPVLEKSGFSVNLGYAGDAENTGHKLIATVAFDLGTLERLGVNVPILKYVGCEPYIAFGGGNLNFKEMGESESDYGLGINLISVRF